MKKKLLGIGYVSLLALLLIACGDSNPSGETNNSGEDQEEVEVKFWR